MGNTNNLNKEERAYKIANEIYLEELKMQIRHLEVSLSQEKKQVALTQKRIKATKKQLDISTKEFDKWLKQ